MKLKRIAALTLALTLLAACALLDLSYSRCFC